MVTIAPLTVGASQLAGSAADSGAAAAPPIISDSISSAQNRGVFYCTPEQPVFFDEDDVISGQPVAPQLALHCIEKFMQYKRYGEDIAELAELASSTSREVVHSVLRTFLSLLDQQVLTDPEVLQGLAKAIDLANPGHLHHNDLAAILDCLTKRISGISSLETERLLSELTALTSLLDAMVAADVKDLKREETHEKLLKTFGELSRHANKSIQYLAKSCEQAMLRLPNDETKIQRYLRKSLDFSEGISHIFVAVKKMKLSKLYDAGIEFNKVFAQTGSKNLWKGSEALREQLAKHAGQASAIFGAFLEFKEVCKKSKISVPWYDVVQYSRLLSLRGEQACKSFGQITEKDREMVTFLIDRKPQLPPPGQNLIHKAKGTLAWQLHELKQRRRAQFRDEKFYIPLQGTMHPQSSERFDLQEKTKHFLHSADKSVLLIQGQSGAGKSLFLRMLEKMLWEEEDSSLPIFIRLSGVNSESTHIVEDALKQMGFTTRQIDEIKTTKKCTLLLDGYDEINNGQLINLVDHGGIKEWKGKIIITCRSQHLANIQNWYRFFIPYRGDVPQEEKLDYFFVAPFTRDQIDKYLKNFLKSNPVPGWDTEKFHMKIGEIKGLNDLVTSPFTLRMTVEVLPTIHEDNTTLLARNLYDAFVQLWVKRQEEKLQSTHRTLPPDFQKECYIYCQTLAIKMHKLHVVEIHYTPTMIFDKNNSSSQWEPWLGPDAYLYRCAVPLIQTNSGFSFIHKSLIEHFASQACTDQISFCQKAGETSQNVCSKQRKVFSTPQHTTLQVESTLEISLAMQSPTLTPYDKDVLARLAIDTIDAFTKSEPSLEIFEELIPLAGISDRDICRRVLEALIAPIKKNSIIDVRYVITLSRAVTIADQETVTIFAKQCMEILQKKIQSVHKSKSNELLIYTLNALENLTCALLDNEILVEKKQIESLTRVLKNIASTNLEVQSACLCLDQALIRLQTNETTGAALFKRAGTFIEGALKVGQFIDTLSIKTLIEGLSTLRESVKVASSRQLWYEEIRIARFYVHMGLYDAYQRMNLSPSTLEAKVVLIKIISSGVERATTEYERNAWLEEIISLALSGNETVKSYSKSVLENYRYYDDAIVAQTIFNGLGQLLNHKSIKWDAPPHPVVQPSHHLIAHAKQSTVWRLAKIKQAILNDSDILRESNYHVPLNAALCETDPKERHFTLDQCVSNFLDSDLKTLLLIGSSGAGKSLSMKILTAKLWRNFQKDSSIPLFISLTGISKDSTTIIQDALQRYGFSSDQINNLQRNQSFIFVLDGYDEMSGMRNVNLLKTNYLLSWKCKIIITCRTQYVKQINQYARFFTLYDLWGRPIHEPSELTILPFNQDQINTYLHHYAQNTYTIWTPALYLSYINRVPGLREMIENPFVLRILTEVLPDIIECRGTETPESVRLTRSDFYEAFVRKWFYRQFDKLVRGGLDHLHQSEIENYYRFASHLARQMVTKNLQEVRFTPPSEKESYYAISDRKCSMIRRARNVARNASALIVDRLKKYDENSFTPFFSNEDPMVTRARVACPLSISFEGNTTVYRFLHISLLEFFGGRDVFNQRKFPTAKLTEIFRTNKSVAHTKTFSSEDRINPEFLNQQLFTDHVGMMRFWINDVIQKPEFRRALLAIIESSKVNPENAIAAANAITILVGAEHNFAGADLSGIRIPGALLDRGNFHNANLQKADLRKCSLHDAFLAGCDLTDAHIEDIDWGYYLYLTEHDSEINELRFSKDGSRIISTCIQKTLVWDSLSGAIKDENPELLISQGQQLADSLHTTCQEIKEKDDSISVIKPSPNGLLLASGHEEGVLSIWDSRDKRLVHTFTENQGTVYKIVFSQDSKLLLTAGRDFSVCMWDIGENKRLLLKVDTFGVLPSKIAISPDGMYLAAGCKDGSICVWKNSKKFFFAPDRIGHTRTFFTPSSVAFSPDGKQLASGSIDTIHLWDAYTGKGPLKTFHEHDCPAGLIAFSPDGQEIASMSSYIKNGSRIVADEFSTIWKIAHPASSPEGKREFGIYDSKTKQKLPMDLRGFIPQQDARAFAPNGEFVSTSAHQSGIIEIWDIRTRWFRSTPKVFLTLEGHSGDISAIGISQDSKRIVSGGEDKTIRVWDATKKQEALMTLAGHTDSVSAVAFSPNGMFIVSGSEDLSVRVWDCENKSSFLTLWGHRHHVYSVAFSPNASLLASSDREASVNVWKISYGEKKGMLLWRSVSNLSLARCKFEGAICDSLTKQHLIKLQSAQEKPKDMFNVNQNDGFLGECVIL